MTVRLDASVASAVTARFRPEIEGLRAVAAILVVVFHVFVGKVSGGVDVFFVVAGFLITHVLLGQVTRLGRLEPVRYFARLAARLLPLALTVLTVTVIATLVLAPVWYQPLWLAQAGWSAIYAENWALAAEAVEYLSRGVPASPVQQFWAMSIQGQFHVMWLLLFAGAFAIVRRRSWSLIATLRRLFAVVFVASLVASIVFTAQSPAQAYFSTFTRIWEFAAGALLALGAARRLRWSHGVGLLAGWVGLLLIVGGGFVLGTPTLYPGWASLVPVIGAVLVLLAGDTGDAYGRFSVVRILGSAPLVWIGGFSYALYLWHWPILALVRVRIPDGRVTLLPGLLIIAAAFVLAVASTVMIDRPLRGKVLARLDAVRSVRVASIAVVITATVAFMASTLTDARLQDLVGQQRVGSADRLASAREDFPRPYLDDCVQRLDDAGVLLCTYGDLDSDTTVALVGGSHAAHWFPAVEQIARERGWRLVVATKDACRFTLRPQESAIGGPTCARWNQALLPELVKMRPAKVITTGTVSDGHGEFVPPGYVDQWRRLDRAGIEVVALRDTARWGWHPVDCLWSTDGDDRRCEVARARSLATTNPLDAVPDLPGNVASVDLTNRLCSADTCPAVIGDRVVYWDYSHLTATFARSLAGPLGVAIPDAGHRAA